MKVLLTLIYEYKSQVSSLLNYLALPQASIHFTHPVINKLPKKIAAIILESSSVHNLLSRSTKNTRPRVLIDEQNRPILKQVHCRKNTSSNSLQSNHSSPKKNYCNNHKNRIAMHQLDVNKNQYLCLQCSLIYAKKGLKIKIINSNVIKPDKSNRQKQTTQYLSKCNLLQNQIQNQKLKYTTLSKSINQQYTKKITKQTQKMQQQILKIKTIFFESIKVIQKQKQLELHYLSNYLKQIQQFYSHLHSTQSDIHNNYQDCIHSFTSQQYRQIMDKYWKQITNTQNFLSQHSLTTPLKPSPDLKLSARTMQKSNNTTVQDFTFSKQKKFQTPPFSKQIRGIKFAQSQPDTNRYQSSLKQSIVDSKIILNDFTL